MLSMWRRFKKIDLEEGDAKHVDEGVHGGGATAEDEQLDKDVEWRGTEEHGVGSNVLGGATPRGVSQELAGCVGE